MTGMCFASTSLLRARRTSSPDSLGNIISSRIKIGNALARGTETLFPVGRMDDTVPSPDERLAVCNPLKLAVFNLKYFFIFLTQSGWDHNLPTMANSFLLSS